MARRPVVEVECTRCHRQEYVQLEEEEIEGTPAVTITMKGMEPVVYDDLCANCTEIVKTAIVNLTKPMEKKSPIRKKKTAEEAAEELQREKQREMEAQPMRVPRG